MYVCMYVCMYMCLNVFVQTCMYIIHLDVYIYMCICFVYDVETIYVTSYEGVSDVWEDGHVHIDTLTNMCVYRYMYIMYIFIYVYIYISIGLLHGGLLQLLVSIYRILYAAACVGLYRALKLHIIYMHVGI